jgi:hypothetical protein
MIKSIKKLKVISTKDNIRTLISEEYERANEKFPLFASNHEAYAVVLEEYEEMLEESQFLGLEIESLWTAIRKDEDEEQISSKLRTALNTTILLIEEAVQTGAMLYKSLKSMDDKAHD